MKTDINLKGITKRLGGVARFAHKYVVLIFIVVVVGVYMFIVLTIGHLAVAEPTDDDVTTKLKTIKRPVVSQDTLNKIQELQSQNVDVKAIFQQARDNPFQN